MELAQKTADGRLGHARFAANQLCGEGWHLPPLRKKLRGNVVVASGNSWGCDGKERGKKKARRAIAWGTEEFHVVGKPC